MERLRSEQALRPKTDELRRLDLNDYELSEKGVTILREDGWECGDEEALAESIALDWPSLRFLSCRNGGKLDESKQSGPSPDEVQERLTLEKVEEWLNQNDGPRCWRAKRFYVANVES